MCPVAGAKSKCMWQWEQRHKKHVRATHLIKQPRQGPNPPAHLRANSHTFTLASESLAKVLCISPFLQPAQTCSVLPRLSLRCLLWAYGACFMGLKPISAEITKSLIPGDPYHGSKSRLPLLYLQPILLRPAYSSKTIQPLGRVFQKISIVHSIKHSTYCHGGTPNRNEKQAHNYPCSLLQAS